MRIRYRIPFSRQLIILDHWEIPFQGGICRVVEENGMAKCLEVVLSGQPIDDAPQIKDGDSKEDIPEIIVDDPQYSLVRTQLEDAAAFLQCQFNVGLDWDDAKSIFEAETEDEKERIHISSFQASRHVPHAVLTFELFAGAIICSESSRGPSFEATLVATARQAMLQERYIDSFRYSFLLMEAIYGGGKFKSIELKGTLKQEPDFRNAVHQALDGFRLTPGAPPSDTSFLLERKASVEELIDHLVDKRGIYFHGNLRRSNAWRPERQKEAQDLAAISAQIALQISLQAAGAAHSPSVALRFNEYAIRAGAQIVYRIHFFYRMPEENFSREHRLSVRTNGTKPTGYSTVEVMKHFLGFFENHAPMGALESAVCVVESTGKKVFEMTFPPQEDAPAKE
jgi:hypothetical protein